MPTFTARSEKSAEKATAPSIPERYESPRTSLLSMQGMSGDTHTCQYGRSPLQRRVMDASGAGDGDASGDAGIGAARAYDTGLPSNLRSGIHALSGLNLDDVKVHYNSPKPGGISARAYAQGSDIHLAPGQDKYLPHEAWHVVQQRQGRVQATRQLAGIAVNENTGLEHEADVMGMRALQIRSGAAGQNVVTAPARNNVGAAPVVQGVFDWAINAAHNTRKVGVEITEGAAGGNRLIELTPNNTPWAVAAPPWAATVNLPDSTGAAHTWHVAQTVNVVPAYYRQAPSKHVWMKWGDVSLTEDHREYEWIVKHPAQPQGVTYYRDRLAEVAAARAQLRTALTGLGLGPSLVLCDTANGYGMTAVFNIPAATAVSSQITFESVDANITRQALLEGTTHGLLRSQMGNRADFVAADQDLVNMVNTAAARCAVPNVDMRLIMAYVVGDLMHKIATLVRGTGWTNAAANFKDWRILFPKSHPYQVLVQSMAAPPTLADINAIGAALNADQANILTDVRTLFAQKLLGLTAATRWQPGHLTGATDPGGHIANAVTGVAPPAAGPPLQTLLDNFLNANVANFLTTEFTNVVNAITDPTGTTHVNVVRSSGFAHHAGSNRGVAFEDRAEVQDQFPGLDATYERIKEVVDRY